MISDRRKSEKRENEKQHQGCFNRFIPFSFHYASFIWYITSYGIANIQNEIIPLWNHLYALR
jgi:hypothetical protein